MSFFWVSRLYFVSVWLFYICVIAFPFSTVILSHFAVVLHLCVVDLCLYVADMFSLPVSSGWGEFSRLSNVEFNVCLSPCSDCRDISGVKLTV